MAADTALKAYEQDPNSVDPEWVPLLEGLDANTGAGAILAPGVNLEGNVDEQVEQLALQTKVDTLIDEYRLHGHLADDIDPLKRPRARAPMLELGYFGLGDAHLDREFHTSGLTPSRTSLREIMRRLRKTYARRIGVEYWHLPDAGERAWLQQRMEACTNEVTPDTGDQLHLLETLAHVENVDHFLHSKFLGAKRFSVSGAESMICLLDQLIERAGDHDIGECIFGMAHRGRLNVLMNVMGKTAAEVFSEFGNTDAESYIGAGDVKYHLGYYRNHTTRAGKDVYLALAFNPSHLEAIMPVVQGRVRAKQDARPERGFDASLGITLHGDAAFAGQGVVSETLNMSRLQGYDTGGMIRVVVNNQIGFTTDPSDSRSGVYATDVAHQINVPIFHINGDDPEAAAYVAKLAVDWRQRFRRDVIIDLVCYRKFGHNEGDDPTFTQPQMYETIRNHPSVRTVYQSALIDRGTTSQEACDKMDQRFHAEFTAALEASRNSPPKPAFAPMHGVWSNYQGGPESEVQEIDTSITAERIEELGPRITGVPETFNLHKKVGRFMDQSRGMCRGEAPLNWATAELLAYATLLEDKHPVRITGQDARRGTFSHRHAVFSDGVSGDKWTPLQNLKPGQGAFEIYNSPLSEFSVLGFEFGYSLMTPQGLVIWEAQFGDFANGAQVIMDQFLSSSEDKWNRISGLTLLLPHGYEGQGPEHSSARLERFLQMCAEDNMQVCNLTTPAQMFHVLRRQVLRKWRKPLVIMTPKSLLRFRPSFSERNELTDGSFQRVIDDPRTAARRDKVERLLICAGKVYYDLDEARQKAEREDVAIVRVEQIYPVPAAGLSEIRSHYPNARELVWVQDEPENMGAWSFIRPHLRSMFGADFRYVGRDASASPATGSSGAHKIERQRILDAAFGEF
jgi:2-oxoglutarate dehydrogenase E1 component